MKWDPKKVAKAVSLLRKRENLSAAIGEISEFFGEQVSEDALRKAFAAYKQPSPASLLRKPKYVPHPIEQIEAKEAERAEAKQIKSMAEELREARKRQAFIDKVSEFKAPPKILAREKSGVREMTAVVLASDWHVEEPVEPESVAYRNEYNLTIADDRVKRFFAGIIWNIEHQRASGKVKIRDLILWLGGDLMSGYIHEELVESCALSPTETVRWLLPRLRDGIYSLLKHLDLEHIEIPCSQGNHGRTTNKTRVSTGYANSFEWLLYHGLADEFRNEPRIHFEITPSAHQYVQVYDFLLHFTHGDSLKYAGGVGGLCTPLMKAVPQWDLVKRSDLHMIGHFHCLSDFGRAIVNGSLIGYGPYAQHIRAAYEEPAQAMFYVDSKRMKTMFTPLWVSK